MRSQTCPSGHQITQAQGPFAFAKPRKQEQETLLPDSHQHIGVKQFLKEPKLTQAQDPFAFEKPTKQEQERFLPHTVQWGQKISKRAN